MYRKDLVSKTGTRLSLPISVADRVQKPRCILLYRAVARNGCGIPLSVVCPVSHVLGAVSIFFSDINYFLLNIQPGATRN